MDPYSFASVLQKRGNKVFLFLAILICSFSSYDSFAQASIVAGSMTTNKAAAYTVGAGNNRIIVVALSGKRGGGAGTVTSITWNGQTFIQAITQGGPTVSPTTRTDIWYMPESNIRAGNGYCTSSVFTIVYSIAPTNEVFTAFTVKDVDQTQVIPAGTSATGTENNSLTATITLPSIATGGANDLLIYASQSSNSARTHTPATGYTEQNELIVGGGTGTVQAVAYKQLSGAGAETPIASWPTGNSLLVITGVVFNGLAASSTAQTTYYSRATGAWDLNTSWSLTEDGSSGAVPVGVWPKRSDNVVIKSGNTITIDAVDDNKGCGTSPDGLGRTNVSSTPGNPFPSSNIAMFYQTGDIVINGTLTVNPVSIMVENNTRIASTGTLNQASSLVNIGYLEAETGSTWTGLDKLALAGTSNTIINTSSTLTDDIILSYTSATLCGTGTTTLTNGGGSVVDFRNGATVSQICTSYTVACSGAALGGCGSSPTTFPLVGTTSVILGNTALGGVGNSSFNRLWLRAHDLNLANNAAVATWADVSGNSLSAANANGTERPSFVTTPGTTANGFAHIRFDGTSDNLSLGTPAVLNFIPGTDSWTFFTVFNSPTNGVTNPAQFPNQGTLFGKAWATTNRNYQYQIDNIGATTTSGMASYIGNGPLTQGTVVCNTSTWTVFSHTNNTTTRSSWTNETADITTVAFGVGADAATDVLIGARRDTGPANGTEGFWYTGNIAEIAMYNRQVNTAQRIIIDNYLSAKYGITMTANEVYTMDASGFDYEVAGIGQASDGSNHRDAQGTGIVRMWNANALGNNEFLTWGHNNATLYSSTTTGVLAPIQERLTRIWAVSELSDVGGAVDVGTVSISFDISSLGTPLGSNLRLLIDRNNNGFADNDVTPIEGSFANNIVVFSGVNFNSGDRFTLGNIDSTNPLPISLLSFTAAAEDHIVRTKWVTASETDNDFFTVERSKDAEQWSTVQIMDGAGTSKTENHYEVVDDGPYNGSSYYRLKQTDFDKKSTYSKVVKVVIDTESKVTLYPNPFSNNFKISADFEINKGQVKLYNSSGVEIPTSITHDGTDVDIDPGKIPHGLYILKVTDGLSIKTIKVIKQ